MEQILPYRLPRLPESIAALRALALNLRWTWEPETLDLFRRLDPELWSRTVDNPALMLLDSSPRKLAAASQDPAMEQEVTRAAKELEEYLQAEGWFPRAHPELKDLQVAYFSMEVGLTECLPFYSGGLGVLAGDHLKAASALNIPLVGVSMLWQSGYFRQMLDPNGWQLDRYPNNIFAQMPLQPQRLEDGSPLVVRAPLPGREVEIQVWRADVGRIPLLLLDTNLPTNSAADRGISDYLYGGDREMRLQQEIVLGIGGLRALHELEMKPDVCHLNESHAAFVGLERARLLMKETGLPFETARQAASGGNIFTTHTPVPAGFDSFAPDLMARYFGDYGEELGIGMESLLALGRSQPQNSSEPFGMAVLALRCASSCNGVSQLHGEVSRKLFQVEFPRFPVQEIPISAVTNGIHTHSWVSPGMVELLHQHLGESILEEPDAAAWEGAASIPDEKLWEAHARGRAQLVEFARKRLRRQLAQRGASREEAAVADSVLHPDMLTVGFARRFAEYKRPTLFLRDQERLKRILLNPDRPVQLILAGKAHPVDEGGKRLIQQIVWFSHDPEVRDRVVFLEDYDMNTTAALCRGVDVWLNNPRRPMEASGTSGMKVLPNGGLNLSVMDGWWAEAYSPELGWAIGKGEEYDDIAYGDAMDAESLYALLEGEIAPLFYDRDGSNLPRGWISKMKASMARLCYRFNTNRMVHEYTERYYLPAAQRARGLAEAGYQRAKALAEWESRVRGCWEGVRIERVDRQSAPGGTGYTAAISLNGLSPEEVSVQVYSDPRDPEQPFVFPLHPEAAGSAQPVHFLGYVPEQGRPSSDYTLRVKPNHPDIGLDLPLVVWEK